MSCKTNIICLLWKGDFRGRDYVDEDVVRLKHMIDKNIDRDYTMYCLTNDMEAKVPANKIELINNWPGWWSKVELFRPDLPCGRTLYLDLDTYIVNSLESLLAVEGDLVMFPSPYHKGQYQAGTMLFTSGTLYWVYDTFKRWAKNYMNKYRSEQDLYGDWIPNQPTFPAKWLMKASDYIRNGYNVKKDTIIISGRPKSVSFRNLVK